MCMIRVQGINEEGKKKGTRYRRKTREEVEGKEGEREEERTDTAAHRGPERERDWTHL